MVEKERKPSMRALSFCLALILTLSFGAGAMAQAAAPVAAPRDAIAAMIAAVTARDAAAIAALYAEDAVVLGAGRPVVAGRDAIRDSWTQSFAAGYAMLEVGRPRTERGSDRAAMVFGWRATIQPAGQAAQQVQGRSLLYFQQVEGGWLISADMWQPAG
jgi:uncharacterized protein (TIGR02246 family)